MLLCVNSCFLSAVVFYLLVLSMLQPTSALSLLLLSFTSGPFSKLETMSLLVKAVSVDWVCERVLLPYPHRSCFLFLLIFCRGIGLTNWTLALTIFLMRLMIFWINDIRYNNINFKNRMIDERRKRIQSLRIFLKKLNNDLNSRWEVNSHLFNTCMHINNEFNF